MKHTKESYTKLCKAYVKAVNAEFDETEKGEHAHDAAVDAAYESLDKANLIVVDDGDYMDRDDAEVLLDNLRGFFDENAGKRIFRFKIDEFVFYGVLS